MRTVHKVLLGLGGAAVLTAAATLLLRKKAHAASAIPAGATVVPMEALSPAQQQQVYDAAAQADANKPGVLQATTDAVRSFTDPNTITSMRNVLGPTAVQPVARAGTTQFLNPLATQAANVALSQTGSLLNQMQAIARQAQPKS